MKTIIVLVLGGVRRAMVAVDDRQSSHPLTPNQADHDSTRLDSAARSPSVLEAIGDRSRREQRLHAVTQSRDPILLGAVIAAVESAFFFQTVSDDPNAAMPAGRRQGVNRALETVKRVGLAPHNDFEGLIVVVAAGFAGRHKHHPGLRWDTQPRDYWGFMALPILAC